ncbi:NUDIX hydrolase [Lutibacter citreus]|uniref:NUDIX hydrolase n=1 Tax=Lutibacter citreus TaxID=2138210 RepID=UPI000DBE7FB7|nr:NUDIX domain-containing protein [Lutibacter citreus]
MYKVFVNDNPIILTENNKISTNLKINNFKEVQIIDLIEELFQLKNSGICLICDDLQMCWSTFIKYFKIQKAAGGKVLNDKNEILFIYRFKKWDLPKGKLEKGESISQCAKREVEEECGVSNLEIKKELETTYHIFKRKHKTILKITHWYLMTTNYSGKLVPQLEEGIEDVTFFDEAKTKEALVNTYENIKLLF